MPEPILSTESAAPIEGVSMGIVHTTPRQQSGPEIQYFEMFWQRGYSYHKGWTDGDCDTSAWLL